MRTLTLLAVVAAVPIVSLAAPLKVSLPPAMGAVPVVMATAWDLFRAEGIEVELIPLPSQRDRMLAFQAGQVDAIVTDLTGAILLVASVPREAVIVGTAFSPEPAKDHLAFITPPALSRIATWDDLVARITSGRRVQIAVPRQSDLEFVVDRVFQEQGIAVPADLYIGQDDLLVNSTWTLLGMVAVGVLPRPHADYILTYTFPGKPTLTVLAWVPGASFPPEVFVVRRSLLESQPETLAAFFRAVRQSVAQLNSEDRESVVAAALPWAVDLFFPGSGPETAAPEVRTQIEAAIAAIVIPTFPEPSAVDPEVYDRVMTWALGKNYLRSPLPYGAAVVPPPE